MHASADVVTAGLWTGRVRVEEIDADTCLLHIAAETLRIAAFLLTVLDAEFEVESPPELAAQCARWRSDTSARHPRHCDGCAIVTASTA